MILFFKESRLTLRRRDEFMLDPETLFFLSVCLAGCLAVWLAGCPAVCLSLLSLSLSLSLALALSVCPPVRSSASRSLSLSLCPLLSPCPSARRSIRLPLCSCYFLLSQIRPRRRFHFNSKERPALTVCHMHHRALRSVS